MPNNIHTFTDMMGREVSIPYPPQRIISLVPSQTELLYDLGLNEEVVGITKFCIHPNKWFRTKQRVGGTKNANIALIKSLSPDLIIANKEENTKEDIEELAKHFPVWISDIKSLDDSLIMIKEVGKIVAKPQQALTLADEIFHGFTNLKKSDTPRSVAYFIWRNPWMCAGGDTFINNMITAMGWKNVLADKDRYPQIDLNELKDLQVDLVLLSSEPYPFKEAHINEIKSVLGDVESILVDGEYFSWYGSRLKGAVSYLAGLVAVYK